MTSSWPKLSRSATTVAFACASSPETKIDEDSPSDLRVDHQRGRQGVEGLDDLGLREGALDLLAEGVGVLDEQGGREALGEVERVGDVDQHLAGQVVRTGQAEHVEGGGAGGGVDDQLGACRCVGEGGERRPLVVGVPGGERRVAHAVGLGAGQGGLGVAGADHDGVAELVEAAGDRLADHAGAENCDVHEMSFDESPR